MIRSVNFSTPPSTTAKNGPLFMLMNSADTGLDFINDYPTQSPRGKALLPTGLAGNGVCIGDYNADGAPDILLADQSQKNRLYRNLGQWRFEDVTDQAGVGGEGRWSTGATFADIDNDGDLDLYVCTHDDGNLLYINQGDGTFSEEAEARGLAYHGASVMMAFSDYDRDGDLDAYLVNNHGEHGDTAMQVKGLHAKVASGQIKTPFIRDENGQVVDVVPELQNIVQVMRVGREYLILPRAERDRLYRNNGDGSFIDVTDQCGMKDYDFGLSATWWDHNEDGWPDLYVANDFFGADRLYQNNGDGTFTDVINSTIPHTPWFSMGTDIGDLNNDGRIDLMASDMAGTSHYRQKVSMGDMEQNRWFLLGAEPRQYMRNTLYLNTRTNRFMEVANLLGLANSDWTWSVKLNDMDNDGWVDVYLTNGMQRDYFNSDWRNRIRRTDRAKHKDVWLDAPLRRDTNQAYKNLGELRFEIASKQWGLDHHGVSHGAAFGDLDQDGDLDLIVNNFDEPTSVYQNQTTGGNSIVIRLKGTTSNSYGIGSRVEIQTPQGRQVRYLTLSRGYMSADQPVIHFGLGQQLHITQLIIDWPSGHRQAFDNLAANQLYTITEPNTTPLNNKEDKHPERPDPPLYKSAPHRFAIQHKELPYNDFKRQPLLPFKLSRLGPGIAVGDVDRDGDDDIYLGAAAGDIGAIQLNNDGTYRPAHRKQADPFIHDQDHEDMAPLFLDADSDGDLDLFVVSGGIECDADAESLQDRLYLNEGNGQFIQAAQHHLPTARESGSAAVAGDVDHDGDLDLFVGGRSVPGKYPLAANNQLLINDGGIFTDQTELIASGLRQSGIVTSALWTDIDGNGWLDLLVTHEWGPIRVYLNHQGTLVDQTPQSGLAQLLGWWTGISGRDLDGDGDIDYVASNFGLNTPYRASKDSPVLLYYGNFDPNQQGQPRILEAIYEHDKLYPWRGKSCSTNAMPFLAPQFKTFDAFAAATLPEIYSPAHLHDALQLAVNTLESVVLINDGSGRFTSHPLPRLAQASPGFGLVLTEVTGDSHSDLYMVQNFFSPQPETGHLDGGLSLLLRGDGHGMFSPMWPDQTGLIVPRDAKGLVTLDLNDDTKPDFVIATNNGPLLGFDHHGSARFLTIRLVGRPGNLMATGSRVTVESHGMSNQTAEVYAGGGYLSQSSSTLTFGRGQNNSPYQVTVTWPDGATSTQTIAPQTNAITISQPGQ